MEFCCHTLQFLTRIKVRRLFKGDAAYFVDSSRWIRSFSGQLICLIFAILSLIFRNSLTSCSFCSQSSSKFSCFSCSLPFFPLNSSNGRLAFGSFPGRESMGRHTLKCLKCFSKRFAFNSSFSSRQGSGEGKLILLLFWRTFDSCSTLIVFMFLIPNIQQFKLYPVNFKNYFPSDM